MIEGTAGQEEEGKNIRRQMKKKIKSRVETYRSQNCWSKKRDKQTCELKKKEKLEGKIREDGGK